MSSHLRNLAQATGEYTREELNKDGKLGWTDKAARRIRAAASRRAACRAAMLLERAISIV